MPMPFKRAAQSDDAQDETTDRKRATRSGSSVLVCTRANWGEEMYLPPIPGFDIDTAFRTLKHHPQRRLMR